MKKLMFATAAMAAGVAMAAGIIETDEIVGFMDKETTAKAPSYGPMFARVGTDGASFKLKDFTAVGMDVGSEMDYIQFLDANDASVILSAVYADEAWGGEEYAGWWVPGMVGEEGYRLDEQEFPAGTAFLGFIGSGSTSTVTYRFAGEVEHGRTVVTKCMAPFIVNPTPVDLKLKEITAVGMDVDSEMDYIQFLDANDASVTLSAVYVDEAWGGEEYAGWWVPGMVGEEGYRLDDTPVPAGAGILGFIGSGNKVTFAFPDPVKKAPAEDAELDGLLVATK